ncbi:nitrilase [Metarhizium album ARSEF 1941]|uniref:Nitrilase n=1 Tax=Metarhizium album (strain ARSEF 1941) TaxID=1081103 RepID=A0A0B2WHM7_METAS|nr:nitrilase [Metarhizium album ARSEF 1941]KHN95521.1 nitrilase [Metarhizium album ARSEF 1941]
MPVIRVGTASPATGPTKAATLRHLADLARRAAAQSIDILLLPEAYIGGYPRGTAFGAVVGDRPYEGREEFAQYFDQAADLGDTVGGGAGAGAKWVKRELGGDDDLLRGDGTREELEKIASDTGVFIVTGIIEKAGGSLYCAVAFVCPKAGVIGKRRKVMPTGTERLCWAQGSPATLKAVSTIIRGQRVNIGTAICWENYMPLVRQALYEQNINLYLAPTADGRDAWMGLMRTVGIEGRCFVVSSNMAVRKDSSTRAAAASQPSFTRSRARRNSAFTDEGFEIALPSTSPTRHKRRKSVFDEDGNEIVLCCDESNGAEQDGATPRVQPGKNVPGADGWISRGGSLIVNPFGDVLAGPQWEDDEGLIFADIDLRECIRGRLDLDTAGHYSRNDSFKFSVTGLDLDPLPY